ncbi:hypothetical protein [Leadbetterella byssophila]|uniref:hypothetical protein n=1 Tax=Leadbetterella byssophila TaxID=316068 RepID=UPI0039A0923C
MKKSLIILFVSLISVSCISAEPERFPKRFSYEREAKKRIDREMRHTRMPRGKYQKIMQKYKHIDALERKAWRDGRLSPHEARQLDKELAHLDRMLYR